MILNSEMETSVSDELVYVHIGKCGGSSLTKAIQVSPVIKERFQKVHLVHIRKPPVDKSFQYLVVVRNPISRAISAFNWRYKLVVSEEVQRERFIGEYEVLKKYGTLSNIAESLYCKGVLDLSVVKDFWTIHHLREDISFYLSELLRNIRSSSVFSVIVQEYMGQDVKNILGVDMNCRINSNEYSESAKKVSQKALNNLRAFLFEDYDAIIKLSDMYPIDEKRMSALVDF